MTVKTSELISKLALASEEGCRCEDENFNRIVMEAIHGKSVKDFVSIEELIKIVRATTDFSRFASIRAICKVLQELDIAENDVDVMNNEDFRNELAKVYK